MIVLIRILASSLPLFILPALAAESAQATGITSVGPAAFLFTIAGALLLTLVFRSVASYALGVITARIGELRIRRVLHARSKDVLHDFILPGAYGGLVKIDHAIRMWMVHGDKKTGQGSYHDFVARRGAVAYRRVQPPAGRPDPCSNYRDCNPP